MVCKGNLKCQICESKEPIHKISCCKKKICKECLVSLDKPICPYCRQDIPDEKFIESKYDLVKIVTTGFYTLLLLTKIITISLSFIQTISTFSKCRDRPCFGNLNERDKIEERGISLCRCSLEISDISMHVVFTIVFLWLFVVNCLCDRDYFSYTIGVSLYVVFNIIFLIISQTTDDFNFTTSLTMEYMILLGINVIFLITYWIKDCVQSTKWTVQKEYKIASQPKTNIITQEDPDLEKV